MDLAQVREKWVTYNKDLIGKFAAFLAEDANLSEETKKDYLEKLEFFGIDYLIDFESELDEDPENEDGGILTLDTVSWGYIDGFLGRWFIQKTDKATEESIKGYQIALLAFFEYLKANKLYKEKAVVFNKLKSRLNSKKKYMKRFTEYMAIQDLKDKDEEEYLEQMQEWEYEDLY